MNLQLTAPYLCAFRSRSRVSIKSGIDQCSGGHHSPEAIYTALLTPTPSEAGGGGGGHYQELMPASVGGCRKYRTTPDGRCLTMTGTIKRGRFKERSVDVQLKLTEDELTKMEEQMVMENTCCCGLRRGPHVLILSLLAIPIMWIYCTLQAFFLGSMTW